MSCKKKYEGKKTQQRGIAQISEREWRSVSGSSRMREEKGVDGLLVSCLNMLRSRCAMEWRERERERKRREEIAVNSG